jgi:hypothetical protein
MLWVDHAGELGAMRTYDGQLTVGAATAEMLTGAIEAGSRLAIWSRPGLNRYNDGDIAARRRIRLIAHPRRLALARDACSGRLAIRDRVGHATWAICLRMTERVD